MPGLPFKVKALYDYTSQVEDDLNFGGNQIITVTEEEDADWYYGQYVNSSGAKSEGLFPKNFVILLEGESTPVVKLADSEDVANKEGTHGIESGSTAPSALSQPAPSGKAETRTIVEDAGPPVLQSDTSTLQPHTQSAAPTSPVSPPAAPKARQEAKPLPPSSLKPFPGGHSAFRDRINAFNKSAAPPVAPMKPGTFGGGGSSAGFVKKAFVAPPPSKNAYVPLPREVPAQKIYRREEDPDLTASAAELVGDAKPSSPPVKSSVEESGDEPKPTSLKDRIALLQKQQMEQAARHTDSSVKKEKPKRPPRNVSGLEGQPHMIASTVEQATDEANSRGTTTDSSLNTSQAAPQSISTPMNTAQDHFNENVSSDNAGIVETEQKGEPLPEQGAAHRQISPEIPILARHTSQSDMHNSEALESKSTKLEDSQIHGESEENREVDGDDAEEDDVDPEVQRRIEIRERMAKMSGGMGMAGMMFGPSGGLPTRPGNAKSSSAREAKPLASPTQQSGEDSEPYATPIQLMPMPGMAQIRKAENDEASSKYVPEHTTDSLSQSQSIEPADTSDHVDGEAPVSPALSGLGASDASFRDNPQLPSTGRPARPPPPPIPVERPPPPLPSLPPGRESLTLKQAAKPEELSHADSNMSGNVHVTPGVFSGPESINPSHEDGESVLYKDARSIQDFGESPHIEHLHGQSSSDVMPISPEPEQARYDSSDSDHEQQIQPHSSRSTNVLPDRTRQDPSNAIQDPESFGENDDEDQIEILHHSGLPSIGPNPSMIPRVTAPPPPPQNPPPKPRASRQSSEMPRTAPPPPPPMPKQISEPDEDYDPYNYIAPTRGISTSRTEPPSLRTPVREIQEPTYAMIQQSGDSPPSTETPQASYTSQTSTSIPSVTKSKHSDDLQRNSSTIRRSTDLAHSSVEHYMAADIDLGHNTQWWCQADKPPPAFQNRPDVIFEIEENTSSRRGGKKSVTKDAYILFQDYSQTIVTAHYDAIEPEFATSLEQRHEPPPRSLRQDQLEDAYNKFGIHIGKVADTVRDTVVGDGSASALPHHLISKVSGALRPVGLRAYGAVVYANLANASVQQVDEIRPGDIVSFRNARFGGHRGAMKSKYNMEVGRPDHVGVVMDWDGSKKKIRLWEQGRENKKVRLESLKLSDLKSGEIKVWRVMSRSWVGWEG